LAQDPRSLGGITDLLSTSSPWDNLECAVKPPRGRPHILAPHRYLSGPVIDKRRNRLELLLSFQELYTGRCAASPRRPDPRSGRTAARRAGQIS
jgi:hypothetical protein